jgi:hypothetical protein
MTLIADTQFDNWFFGHSHRRCRATVGRTDIRCVSIGYIDEQGMHSRLVPLRDLIVAATAQKTHDD